MSSLPVNIVFHNINDAAINICTCKPVHLYSYFFLLNVFTVINYPLEGCINL